MRSQIKTYLLVAGGIALFAFLASMLATKALAEGEIIINSYMKVDKDDYDQLINVQGYTTDMLGDSMAQGIQAIQTNTHEQIIIPADVATNGYSWFRNVTTNRDRWVDLGVQDASTNFIAMIRLNGSDIAGPLPLHPTNNIYARGGSTTSGVSGINLQFWIVEK